MALAIATNNAALNAAAAASSVNRDMETSMARLSSGKRINSASDDAAGVAISSRLSAEIRGTDQAIRNALDGQALIDTAEGAHSEIENILQRMREVSVQAANDTNNNQDRANLQAEMSALVTEIDRIAGTTTWAGEKLMEAESGTKFSFQVGAKTSDKNQIEININGMGAHALGLQADSVDVQRTLSEVTVGQSINTVDYNPALQIRQGTITSGVVTANNGNTSITLPKLTVTAVSGVPVASVSGGTLTVDPGAVGRSGDLVVAFDVGTPITIPLDGTEADVAAIATKIETAINVGIDPGVPVASISGNTLTVDGTAATAGNLVLSLDSGPDITIPLDGNEADAAAIATKIETAVNDAFTEFPDHGNPATVPPSSGTIATANGDGTVTFDFTNPTAALVVSLSGGDYSGQHDGGTLMTIAPNAVGSSGLLELRFDQGSNIDVEFDGNEADLDAIAAKIVTAINDNIPTNSGGTIATANGNGTITFDFSDAGGSGSGFNGVSYVEVEESDPFNTARLEPATSVQINTTTTTTHLAGFGPANVASANAIGTVDIDFTGDLSATPYNGASITSIDPASTARLAPSLILSDVTYDTTSPSSINAAVDAINAATGSTNITASVGADGSNNAGKIVLAHNTDAAAGIGEHGSLSSVYTAYDTANSDPAATIEVIGQEGVISFHEEAGTAFKLVLARVNSTGAPQETFTIDTTADLQIAVDAINGSSGAGTTAHGYTAEVVAAADGSTVGGTIKLISGSAHSDNTQVSFSSLDLGRVGDTSQTMPLAADGVFDATTGVFTPGNVNTSGTVNLTLGDTEVTVSGISNKGADASGDAAKIAAAISAGNHGYTAAAMTGADTGKVKITQPAAPTKDMDVNSADKARESIVAIDNAIQTVNIQRSSLGAVSNRLSHTINNLTNISSNLSAAQGGIEDADFAHETTMLAKNQILQQASTAMLAQANASKQNVLSLLQG